MSGVSSGVGRPAETAETAALRDKGTGACADGLWSNGRCQQTSAKLGPLVALSENFLQGKVAKSCTSCLFGLSLNAAENQWRAVGPGGIQLASTAVGLDHGTKLTN